MLADKIFIVSIIILAVALFLRIIEYLGVSKFSKIIYKIGIPVKSTIVEVDYLNKDIPIQQSILLKEGKYKFLNKNEALFSTRWTLPYNIYLNAFSVPFKNIAKIEDGFLKIHSKVSILPAAIVPSFITCILASTIATDGIYYFTIALFVVLFIGLIILSYMVKKYKPYKNQLYSFNIMKEELINLLSGFKA